MTISSNLERASARLEANPEDASAWVEAAQALDDAGAVAEAVEAWRQATSLMPDHPAPWLGLGRTLAAAGVRDEPGHCYRRALAADASNTDARLSLGLWLMHRGELDEALLCLAEVSRAEPQRSDARSAHALCLHRTGAHESAWTELADAGSGTIAAVAAAEMAQTYAERAVARGRVEEALSLHPDDPLLLHHHAELLDAVGEYKAAWHAVVRANAGRSLDFDADSHLRSIDALIDSQPAGSWSGQGSVDVRPILIVGMPRSGSTLVEQVLACHPDVVARGELYALSDALVRLGGYPLNADADAYAREAQRYSDVLDASGHRVTDKMPNNVLHLGLAAHLVPNAHVVFVQRDPLETCWSCFRHAMAAGLPWAASLEGLAAWTVGVHRLMAHYREVLPMRVHTVCYEDLVSDAEPTIRALLDAVDLPFDAACLRPHESDRIANTMSIDAVREPIHDRAVNRSEPYAEWLEPLARVLADAGLR